MQIPRPPPISPRPQSGFKRHCRDGSFHIIITTKKYTVYPLQYVMRFAIVCGRLFHQVYWSTVASGFAGFGTSLFAPFFRFVVCVLCAKLTDTPRTAQMSDSEQSDEPKKVVDEDEPEQSDLSSEEEENKSKSSGSDSSSEEEAAPPPKKHHAKPTKPEKRKAKPEKMATKKKV